jgi:hypothetical protein
MFSKQITDAIIVAANAENWPASALLAVVECETSGSPFEQDGHTPTLLFERHKFYSELQTHQPSKLKKAIAAGLAIPKWSRNTQYKDQGKSAGRLAVIAKAREIDIEVANRAASWGLGQTMGFNAERLKYHDATDMVGHLSTGAAAQIEALVREIKTSHLDKYLVKKDFTSFARGYNGAGFKQNNYDVRMRNADAAWARRLANDDLHEKPAKSITLVYQSKLKELNFAVGKVDGDWGDMATGATSAFQRREGLKITGHPDDETTEALDNASTPREVSMERAEATVDDLRSAGSQTVAAAERGSLMTKILLGLGVTGGAQQTGALDQAQQVVGKVQAAKGMLDTARDLLSGLAPYWWVGVLVAGYFAWREYGDVIKHRLNDEKLGLHIGR